MPSTGFPEEKPLSRSELLVAMALFALTLLGILGAAGILPPKWLDDFLLLLCAGGLLIVLGWTFVKGFPRWSLPYLGLVLLLGIILLRYDRIWGWIYPLFLELFGPRSLWRIPVRIPGVPIRSHPLGGDGQRDNRLALHPPHVVGSRSLEPATPGASSHPFLGGRSRHRMSNWLGVSLKSQWR